MSSFSPEGLAEFFRNYLPVGSGSIFIGFSGGLDSSVLLQATAGIRERLCGWRLVAIHVDHQLKPVSSQWADRCRQACLALGVECVVERVQVDEVAAHGLEAAARTARYAAYGKYIRDNDVLLTGHHADDQAETLLLALMRGSGVRGLAAMPMSKRFRGGFHLRPLLPYTRGELETWSRSYGIEAIQDPSNTMLRHDRNFLRQVILPQLRSRWPSVSASLGRSTQHLGEALSLLDERAEQDLATCGSDRCLSISALRRLTPGRMRNLLRYWFRRKGLLAPSTRKLMGLMHDVFNSSPDRIPTVSWQGVELHWYRGLLYAETPQTAEEEVRYERLWRWSDSLTLPEGLGVLTLRPSTGPGFSLAKLPLDLTVRFRRGGEKILLPGRQHRSALRNLLQEMAVLPWWREKIPLIFAGKRLLAVGDLLMSDEFAAHPGETSGRIVWEGAPAWRAEPDRAESV